jgi:hypothetical protein
MKTSKENRLKELKELYAKRARKMRGTKTSGLSSQTNLGDQQAMLAQEIRQQDPSWSPQSNWRV